MVVVNIRDKMGKSLRNSYHLNAAASRIHSIIEEQKRDTILW